MYVDILIAKNSKVGQWCFEDYRFFYVVAFYRIYSLR